MLKKPESVTWGLQPFLKQEKLLNLSSEFLMEQVKYRFDFRCPSSVQGTAYREYGVLYLGRNFDETSGVPSVDDCAQRCKDSGLCKFWWWEENGTNRCALKQVVSAKKDVRGYISGNKP